MILDERVQTEEQNADSSLGSGVRRRTIPGRQTTQLMTNEILECISALRRAGRLQDMAERDISTVLIQANRTHGELRPADILKIYYEPKLWGIAERRQSQDGYFRVTPEEELTAPSLLRAVSQLVPELKAPFRLDRIGGRAGAMIVRSGSLLSAVCDPSEIGELDHQDEEDRTVSARSLLHAVNQMLNQVGSRQRFIPFAGCENEEVYLRLPLAHALEFTLDGYLDLDNTTQSMAYGSW